MEEHVNERLPSEVLAAADKEVNEYFTTSLGVKAQSYDGGIGGGGGGSDGFVANAVMTDGHLRRESTRTENAESMLNLISNEARRVLELVYYPRARSWVADHLKPEWGHGSFETFGAWTIAGARGFARAHGFEGDITFSGYDDERFAFVGETAAAAIALDPRTNTVDEWNLERDDMVVREFLVTPGTVLDWLRSLTKPAAEVDQRQQKAMLGNIVTECERRRTWALEAYDFHRRERVANARAERAATRAVMNAQKDAFLAELLAQKHVKYSKRLDQRLARLARAKQTAA
jgi:hypothetical protein